MSQYRGEVDHDFSYACRSLGTGTIGAIIGSLVAIANGNILLTLLFLAYAVVAGRCALGWARTRNPQYVASGIRFTGATLILAWISVTIWGHLNHPPFHETWMNNMALLFGLATSPILGSMAIYHARTIQHKYCRPSAHRDL